YGVVALSFDPREGPALAAQKKKLYLERLGRPQAAPYWNFLTGREADIRRVTEAAGFRYAWDAERSQYAHAAGLLVLSPEGRVSKVLYGVEYPAGDLRLALVEAGAGRVGTLADRVLLYC